MFSSTIYIFRLKRSDCRNWVKLSIFRGHRSRALNFFKQIINSYQLLAVTSAPPPQTLFGTRIFWFQYLIFAPPPLTPYTFFFIRIPEFETQKLLNFIKFQYLANLCAPDL